MRPFVGGRRAQPGGRTPQPALPFCTLVPSRQTRPLPPKGRPSEHREPTQLIQSPCKFGELLTLMGMRYTVLPSASPLGVR